MVVLCVFYGSEWSSDQTLDYSISVEVYPLGLRPLASQKQLCRAVLVALAILAGLNQSPSDAKKKIVQVHLYPQAEGCAIHVWNVNCTLKDVSKVGPAGVGPATKRL